MLAPRSLTIVWLLLLAGCVNPRYPVSGLRPIYPPPGHQPQWFVTVDSLTPTLRWEAFPRPADVVRDGRLAGLAGVTYDLRIWRVSESGDGLPYPGALAYSRDGLVGPQHTLETPLEGGRKYVWTVRAAFELEGRPRVTQWGMLAPPGLGAFRDLGIVSPLYFRLKSPSG
jgi:hypothetical protein